MRNHRSPWIATGLVAILFFSAGSLYLFRHESYELTVDGQTRTLEAKSRTIQELLNEARVVLGPDDFVSPGLETRLKGSMHVKVTRVTKRLLSVEEKLPPTIHWSNRTRQNLRRVLVQKGTAPMIMRQVRVTLHDGKEVQRDVISEKRNRRPFFTLTLFNDRGFPIKTYDLLQAKTKKMLATGYYVGDPMVPGDTTFLGHKLQRGLIAVDPKTLPLRMRLYIPGYGYAYSSDTGSAIKKNRIDLAVKDRKEERRYSHRWMTVYVLEKAKKW